VRVPDPELPSGDRIAHLLLALRADEEGFATVANLASRAPAGAFAPPGPAVRPALDAGARAALDMKAGREPAARTGGPCPGGTGRGTIPAMNPAPAAAARILLLERRDGSRRDRSGARVRR
jgi:hypothetical protein